MDTETWGFIQLVILTGIIKQQYLPKVIGSPKAHQGHNVSISVSIRPLQDCTMSATDKSCSRPNGNLYRFLFSEKKIRSLYSLQKHTRWLKRGQHCNHESVGKNKPFWFHGAEKRVFSSSTTGVILSIYVGKGKINQYILPGAVGAFFVSHAIKSGKVACYGLRSFGGGGGKETLIQHYYVALRGATQWCWRKENCRNPHSLCLIWNSKLL